MDTGEVGGYEAGNIKEQEHKILNYLFNATNVLRRCSNRREITCHFLSRCDSLEEVRVPKNLFRARCKYCYHPFEEGSFALRVRPKKSPGKRMRKIYRKASLKILELKPIEKKLLLNTERNSGNKLVLKCLTCQKEIVKPMLKPPVNQRYIMKEVPENVEKKKKKKKKRKKDAAGLKIPKGSSANTSAKKGVQTPKKKQKRGVNLELKKVYLGSSEKTEVRKHKEQKKQAEKKRAVLKAKFSNLNSEMQGSSLTSFLKNFGRKIV